MPSSPASSANSATLREVLKIFPERHDLTRLAILGHLYFGILYTDNYWRQLNGGLGSFVHKRSSLLACVLNKADFYQYINGFSGDDLVYSGLFR